MLVEKRHGFTYKNKIVYMNSNYDDEITSHFVYT